VNSQIRIVLFQLRNQVPRCIKAIERVKWVENGRPVITPFEAAEEIFDASAKIFKDERPSDQLLCFLLLLARGNKIALKIVELLLKGGYKFSVNDALEDLEEELAKECEKCRERTRQTLETLMKDRSVTRA
jgi:hypothetical protein